MTLTLFLTLLAIFATASSLLTQCVKRITEETGRKLPSNILAAVVAFVVGAGGTAADYLLDGIPFTAANIACMALMGLACAIASMIGYDKVMQAIKQIAEHKKGGQ